MQGTQREQKESSLFYLAEVYSFKGWIQENLLKLNFTENNFQ